MRAEASFVQAFCARRRRIRFSFVATILVLLFVTLSFFVATIPGEKLDKLTQQVLGIDNEDETGQTARFVAGYAVPLLSFGSEGSLFGIFQRNLKVTDVDLVVDKDQTPGEPSVSLRGRDFRFAQLDRSDLHQADLTGVRSARREPRRRGSARRLAAVRRHHRALLTEDRVAAKCTTARRANFTRARLEART